MELEEILIRKILMQEYFEFLPSERELAKEFKVSRQKLREILKKLEYEGWIKIEHGKPTKINSFLEDGGLDILNSLIKHKILELPGMNQKIFLIHLLEIRYALAPLYTKDAIQNNLESIIKFMEAYLKDEKKLSILKESSVEITYFDWNLHKLLCKNASNKIYLFLLNSFRDIYLSYGNLYFSQEYARDRSILFYKEFYKNLKKNKITKAIYEIKKVTKESIEILKKALNKELS